MAETEDKTAEISPHLQQVLQQEAPTLNPEAIDPGRRIDMERSLQAGGDKGVNETMQQQQVTTASDATEAEQDPTTQTAKAERKRDPELQKSGGGAVEAVTGLLVTGTAFSASLAAVDVLNPELRPTDTPTGPGAERGKGAVAPAMGA